MCVWMRVRADRRGILHAASCLSSRFDTDESKLDGDGVHPLGGLIILAAVLLILPLSPSRWFCVSLSVSVSAVQNQIDELSLSWHDTHPFVLLGFSTWLTPSTTPPTHTHTYTPLSNLSRENMHAPTLPPVWYHG